MAKSKRKPTPRRTSASRARSGGAPGRSTARPPTSTTRKTAGRGAVPTGQSDSAFRTAVADHSRGLVVYLSRLPTFFVPAFIVVLMIVGLAAPVPIGAVALAIIIAFISWLAYLSWPVIPAGARGVRVLAIGLVVVAIVGRIAGWF